MCRGDRDDLFGKAVIKVSLRNGEIRKFIIGNKISKTDWSAVFFTTVLIPSGTYASCRKVRPRVY